MQKGLVNCTFGNIWLLPVLGRVFWFLQSNFANSWVAGSFSRKRQRTSIDHSPTALLCAAVAPHLLSENINREVHTFRMWAVLSSVMGAGTLALTWAGSEWPSCLTHEVSIVLSLAAVRPQSLAQWPCSVYAGPKRGGIHVCHSDLTERSWKRICWGRRRLFP